MAPGTRELGKGDLLAVLGEIFREKESGTLVLQQAEVSRFLYLQEGQLIFAASNAPQDKFTQILIDQGKLSYEQLDLAAEKKGNRTIGRTLVEMGFLSSEDLLKALVDQLRRIAFSAQNWNAGTAAFKPGVLPQNVARLPISTPRFLVDLALALEDREVVAQALGRLDAPLEISAQNRVASRAMGLSAEEARVLEQVDGVRSARQVCERAGVDLFTGAKFLTGLAHLGFLSLKEPVGTPGPTQPVPPVDLSFLDDTLEPARPQPERPPAPAPPPPVQALPFEEQAKEDGSARIGLIEEKPSPKLERTRRPLSRDAKPAALPELLPIPSRTDDQAQPPQEREAPAFLLEKPSRTYPLGRWIGVAAGLAVVVAAGALAGWYYFLRESPVVSLPPPPPPRAKAQAVPPAPAIEPPAAQAPPSGGNLAAAAPQPAAPAPASQPKAAEAGPVPGGAGLPGAAPAPKPAAEEKTRPPAATPAAAPPGSGSPWDLMAKGDYAGAAQGFRRAFQGRKAGYVVTIEVACQPETVAKGLAAAAGSRDYAILPYDLKGRACYLVVWGDYPDRPTADAALKAMPGFFLQNAQPRVVPWSKIQELSSGAP
jgi:hypothetical protein